MTATRINEGVVSTAEFLMAQLDRLSREGDRMYYAVGIVDLEGLGPHHLWGESKEWLSNAIDIIAQNYRDATTLVIVVNAPLLFRAGWAIISGFLTQRQREKACVLGSSDDPDVQGKIFSLVPKEILPQSLGGLRGVRSNQEQQIPEREEGKNASFPETEAHQDVVAKPSRAVGRFLWEGQWFLSAPLFVISHPVFFLLAPWFLSGWSQRDLS